jgi:hypothetical protein
VVRATPDTGKLTPRLYALAHPAGQPGSVASQLPPASNAPDNTPGGMERLANGQVVVDVLLTDTSPSTLAQLAQAGATVQATSAPLKTVTATVAPDHLANLEALSQVRSVRDDPAPQSNACMPVTSQGDKVLQADKARTNFGVNGAGQTVGVVSDSFNVKGGQAADVAGGELPGATNPCGFTTPVNNAAEGPVLTGTDEGRAMAQIVHSLAPGSPLAFENSGTSDLTMANNLTDLRTNQGAKVLTDDVTYFDEPFYQDGPISNALTQARAANVPSFSSAANANINVGGNDVASLEALQYQPDVNCPASLVGAYPDCHNFSPTNAPSPDDRPSSGYTVPTNGTLNIDLQWAQPWGGVSTEYDLFIVNQAGAVVSSSTNDTITNGIPFQNASFKNTGAAANYYVVVARKAGPEVRFKYVNLGREGSVNAAEFNTSQGNNVVGPTIFGHNGASNVYSLAASNWQTPSTPESYSSHGPLTTLFEPVPSTIGVPAQVVTKPDFTASDCVTTTVPGFAPFCGTSASAPHAAAIAALMLQRKPINPTQVGQLMTQTSTPMSFGRTVVGSGLLNANSAVGAVPEPYNPLTPARITDTRPNSGFPNAGNTPGPGGTINVQVTGAGGVPVGATAAVLNVTATNPTRQSFLTAWPTGATRPTASNLNFSPGQTVPNLAEVGLGSNGQVSVFNAAGSADVVVDVEGYVAPAPAGTGLYNPLEPARIADTRPGSGLPNEGQTLQPGGTINVQVTGAGNVPATGVAAVVLNVTATNPTRSSFFTVWPRGNTRPTASNVNFVAGQTVPNRVQVPVGTNGQVSIFNPAGSVDAVVDVSGYFTDNSNAGATGSQFTPVTPVRISDTRPNSGFPNAGETLGARDTRVVQVAGASRVPASGLTAAVMNVTATNTTASSFLTVWPFGVLPASSDLNWVSGRTVANLTAVQLNPFGQVQEFNAAGSMDAVVDVSGWYW